MNTISEISQSQEELWKSCRNNFEGHYVYWRIKRITAIVEYYGEKWFKGKKILELGCGFGDIGYVLMTLGAEVVFAEGRKENCDYLRKRFPNNRVYQMNCESEWPFSDEKFDMILHLGLLYHLDNFTFSLRHCFLSSDIIVLETEVCDSDDKDFILKIAENATGYDQSLIGVGSRPSAKHIEAFMKGYGWNYERVADSRCNALFHIYDWPVQNTNTWRPGLRRFWYCRKEKNV